MSYSEGDKTLTQAEIRRLLALILRQAERGELDDLLASASRKLASRLLTAEEMAQRLEDEPGRGRPDPRTLAILSRSIEEGSAVRLRVCDRPGEAAEELLVRPRRIVRVGQHEFVEVGDPESPGPSVIRLDRIREVTGVMRVVTTGGEAGGTAPAD